MQVGKLTGRSVLAGVVNASTGANGTISPFTEICIVRVLSSRVAASAAVQFVGKMLSVAVAMAASQSHIIDPFAMLAENQRLTCQWH
jgi:hypothetical protein